MILSDQNFQQILRCIEDETGIRLPETNYSLVKRFVSERLLSLTMNVAEYLKYIREQGEEYKRFVDAITINETYFFREEKQFQVIDKMIFPRFTVSPHTHFAFWSAACSSGEEAISIATLAERCWGASSTRTYSVVASDLNSSALKTLENGVFRANSFRTDGSGFHRFLSPFIQQKGKRWLLHETLKQKITIKHLNLFRDKLETFSTRFHLILLRNILVYMPLHIRQKILDKIVSTLADEGYLFLASSETPLISHPDLKLQEYRGVYFFQKKTFQDKTHSLSSEMKLMQEVSETAVAEQPVRQASHAKRELKAPVSVQEILVFANQKLNNKLFLMENNINYSLALQFLRIVYSINTHKRSNARELLNRVHTIAAPNEISMYLSGYLEMVEQHDRQAIRHFHKALSYNNAFWPAQFYLGVLLQKSSARKARQEFINCQKNITAYLQEKSYMYQFLLEGFNAKYFLEMCRKWIEKLNGIDD